jgi:hypothetical protein
MDFIKGLTLFALSLSLLAGWGCASIGPGTVTRDRFDYTGAISESWKTQMLLNMVKMRYGDTPVFLDVSSVISQYQIMGRIDLGATFNSNPWGSSQILGGSGTYVDRPTITYSPVMGDKFARSLMSPIPPPAILGLLQSGYPADLVFRMMVSEINGIGNRFGGEARAQSADPEFYPLLEKLRKVQSAGALGMRFKKVDKEEAALMVLRPKRDAATDSLAQEIRRTLGLDSKASVFRVVYGSVPRDDQEIALLTRSILDVLVDLSADIEVPAVHVKEKRVNPAFAETVAGEKIRPLIRIQGSSEEPGDAFVSVRYRNSYFWIDDRDLGSKKIFSFLMFVFNLVETGEKGMAPVVTIPTG